MQSVDLHVAGINDGFIVSYCSCETEASRSIIIMSWSHLLYSGGTAVELLF